MSYLDRDFVTKEERERRRKAGVGEMCSDHNNAYNLLVCSATTSNRIPQKNGQWNNDVLYFGSSNWEGDWILKFKNIKKNSPPITYQDNLFIAVSDHFMEMIVNADLSRKESRKIILRDVKFIIDDLEKEIDNWNYRNYSSQKMRNV